MGIRLTIALLGILVIAACSSDQSTSEEDGRVDAEGATEPAIEEISAPKQAYLSTHYFETGTSMIVVQKQRQHRYADHCPGHGIQ